MILTVGLNERSYDVVVEKGGLEHVCDYFDMKGKVLVLTDYAVPPEYPSAVVRQAGSRHMYAIGCDATRSGRPKRNASEKSKNYKTYLGIMEFLEENNFTRNDCIVAVGGGVTSDLAGFVASTYMRGIGLYTVPTTLLSMVDASVGGKNGINHNGIKNVMGTFYQPKKVLIDPDVLKTLPGRQILSGWAEIIKMAATLDGNLFLDIEKEKKEISEDIIGRAVAIKKNIVEEDEKESGLRKVLNFGHTIGHGIEAYEKGKMTHGECVALGMLAMSDGDAKERILAALKLYGFKTSYRGKADKIMELISHDKKASGDKICCALVKDIGSYELKDLTMDEIKTRLESLKD